ncbi:putative CENPB DNA-binding domain-containing protein 1 [Palaemon carinicauda]|uniref:putative CENPB DNA-binding domain-containing protein 1 n=1 Tax=Palaemon carinicauda TaxID=392227 RepID=UPI0035B64236
MAVSTRTTVRLWVPKIASEVKGRSKKMITMKTKLEIIKKYEEGMHIVTLANTYGHNQSTIGTIIKNKEAIKANEAVDDPATEGDVEEIISIGMSMGPVVDEADIHNLIQEHREELTTEDLKEL